MSASTNFENLVESSGQIDAELRQQVKDIKVQLDALQQEGSAPQAGPAVTEVGLRACTAVLGGLVGLSNKQEAEGWLQNKLAIMSGPVPIETFVKSGDFRGILFARFKNSSDRDKAVVLLRGAGLNHSGNDVWAKEDLPIQTRSTKAFLFGLKRVLKTWGFSNIHVDDNFKYITVGTEVVATDGCMEDQLLIKWHDAWSKWQEFQSSVEVGNLVQTATEMMNRARHKGKGAAKGSVGK
ncbi:unnamed protein product [Polarella glacialis]|uniref:Uncharacterized protein n=1 Tax=Polarella glacialis TaxID=89957 RepID=A0A813G340_POLGL|nr:unnamed protein product [Polarella glacialis]